MNVLLINGSPHPKGCTYTALNMVAAQLEKNGLSTRMLHVGNKAVHGCMACGKCAETRQCVFTDDPVNEAIMPVPMEPCAHFWIACSLCVMNSMRSSPPPQW